MKIGTIKRRDQVGLKGRAMVVWLACKKCGKERWVMYNSHRKKNVCAKCRSRQTIKAKAMNLANHRTDCKCHRCRIGKGYFKGSNNPMWNGGVKQLTTGYIMIYVPDNHKFASMRAYDGGNYVMEHRLVMAESLGRPLTKTETVHHKNGVKSDNRLENLELWATKHHSGQRVSEMNCPHCGKNIYSNLKQAICQTNYKHNSKTKSSKS